MMDKHVKLTVGRLTRKITEELNRHHYHWPALSKIAGLAESTVLRFRDCKYSDGPKLSTVVKLAAVFGLDVDFDKAKSKGKDKKRKLKIRRAA